MRGPDGYAVCPLCHNEGTKFRDQGSVRETGADVSRAKGPKKASAGQKSSRSRTEPDEIDEDAPAPRRAPPSAVFVQNSSEPSPRPVSAFVTSAAGTTQIVNPQVAPPMAPQAVRDPVADLKAGKPSTWQPEPILGKSVAGAVARSWFMPGWGQGYVHGTATGWKWFLGTVGVYLAAFLLTMETAPWAYYLIAIPVGIFQVSNAGMAASDWNKNHGATAPKNPGAVWAIVILAIVGVISLIFIIAILSPSGSNLDAPLGADVLYESQLIQLDADEYNQAPFQMIRAGEFTFAFKSESGDVIDVCVAYPQDNTAFASGTTVNCLLAHSGTHGKRTAQLPAGNYVAYSRSSDGSAASYKVSAWVVG